MYRKYVLLLLSALAVCANSFAVVPAIDDVSVDGRGSSVLVSYRLSGGPAIVTMELSTNGVALPSSLMVSANGDVARIVANGRREIKWNSKGLLGEEAYKGDITATLKAWPLAAPPDYVVFDLSSSLPKTDTHFYADANSVPGGISDDRYKTTHLLMRKIPAAGKTWHVGMPSSEVFAYSYYVYIASRSIYRPVVLTKDYYLGVYEVTQGQCEGLYNFSDRTPGGRGTDGWQKKPMNNQFFANVRGTTLGAQWPDETMPHNVDDGSIVKAFQNATGISSMDLPTDVQWEIAARAGTWQNHYDGTRNYMYLSNESVLAKFKEIGWSSSNSESAVHEVGLKPANPWGLYDMYGNVSEMCLDWFATDSVLSDGTLQTDPKGPDSGDTRVNRGGGYNGNYNDLSSVGKSSSYPATQRFEYMGLRLACDADFSAFGE